MPPDPDADATTSDEPSVAIVGGGVVGTTTALTLAEREVDVTLYEAGDVGSGATGLAAGICHDAYPDPVDARLAAAVAIGRFQRDGPDAAAPQGTVDHHGGCGDAVAAVVSTRCTPAGRIDVSFPRDGPPRRETLERRPAVRPKGGVFQ